MSESALTPQPSKPPPRGRPRIAVRFATDIAPVVRAEELGSLAALVDVPDPGKLADVIALDRLADEPGMLDLLTAVCATASIRQAAGVVHRHHSSIAARLEHAQAVLGFPIDTPDGRFRLHLALILRRLRDNG